MSVLKKKTRNIIKHFKTVCLSIIVVAFYFEKDIKDSEVECLFGILSSVLNTTVK